MKRKASRAVSYIAGLALGALAIPASAIAQDQPMTGEEPQPMSGGDKQGSMKKVEKTSMTATVEAVDQDNNLVTLRSPKGETKEIEVGEDVDLSGIQKGDQVKVDYVESLALSLNRPGEPKPQVNVEEAKRRLPDGVEMGRQVTATGEITKVDQQKETVTIRGPQGKEHTIQATTPAAKEALKDLKAGDQVEATYTQAMAVRVEPVDKQQKGG